MAGVEETNLITDYGKSVSILWALDTGHPNWKVLIATAHDSLTAASAMLNILNPFSQFVVARNKSVLNPAGRHISVQSCCIFAYNSVSIPWRSAIESEGFAVPRGLSRIGKGNGP